MSEEHITELQKDERVAKSSAKHECTRWYRFRVIGPAGLALLRGSTSTCDRRFGPLSRGRQVSAACVVALICAQLIKPQDWLASLIDQVIDCGDQLYRMSRARFHFDDETYVGASLLLQEFYVGDYKCRICTEAAAISGNLFCEATSAGAVAGALKLADGLRTFLQHRNFGVLNSQGVSVAIWSDSTHGYFCFNPAPTDAQGVRCSSGFGCLIRSTNIEELSNIFLSNLNEKYDSEYCIDRIKLTKVKPIGRGKYQSRNATDIIVDKEVLQTMNPDNVEDVKLQCTALVPKTEIVKKKEPLGKKEDAEKNENQMFKKLTVKIEITNDAIEAKLAAVPLACQFLEDERYSYKDTQVNIPSTLKPTPDNPDLFILHGWTHENSDIYKAKGAQTAANCAMCFAMKAVNPVRTWLRKNLDEILAMGDALFAEVKATRPSIKKMTAADLDDALVKVADRQFVIDIQLITIMGTVISTNSGVLSLKNGLEDFFLKNINGILEFSSSKSMAIWIEDDYYYTFDPLSCDINGTRVNNGSQTKDKKGNVEKEKVVIGKCCVMRFPHYNSMYAHILKNLDPEKSRDRYTIRRVSILDDIPGSRTWNSFKPGGVGKSWILSGSINRDDNSFSEYSRNVQGLAIPVVTLVAAHTIIPAEWYDEEVNETLREADAYYNWCIPPVGELIESDDQEKALTFNNLKKHLYYKKCKTSIDVKESCIISDSNEVSCLEHGLVKFFENHQYGIVESNNQFFAVWKFEEELKDKSKQTSYYLFNDMPSEKFYKNIPLNDTKMEPFACILRFFELKEVAALLAAEFQSEDTDAINAGFYIHEVKLVSKSSPLSDDEIQKDKIIPIKPQLQAYSTFGETGAILIGSFNQADAMLFKRETKDKQQAATALVTLAMAKLFDCSQWNQDILDDVLKMGDKLTAENLSNIVEAYEEDEENRDYMIPIEIGNEFSIGVNKIIVEIEDKAVVANFKDILKVLEEFFTTKRTGILRYNELMYPIWKENNLIFIMDPKGKLNNNASVYWFLDVESMAELIQAFTETVEGDFTIDYVSITNQRTEIENTSLKHDFDSENSWYNFQKIRPEGVWEINCNVLMTSDTFVEENRGNQSAAISVIAIIFSKIYEPQHLSVEILDEIIITGDKLHLQNAAHLGENKSFYPKEIMSEFFLSNRRINLDVQDCVQAGKVFSHYANIQNISEGIQSFFNKFTAGCLTLSKNFNLAIWMNDEYLYSLNPETALTRYKNCSLLIEDIMSQYSQDTDFEITMINVVDWNKLPPWKYDPSLAVRPSNLPYMNAFSTLPGKAKAILRGNIHQSSEIIPDDIRGLQTASNCMICLAMATIKNPTTWTRQTLDRILALAVNLHRESLPYVSNLSRVLKPKDVIRIFQIGVNVLAADVEDFSVTGIVAHPLEIPEVKGTKQKKPSKEKSSKKEKKANNKRALLPPPPPLLLEEGLDTFFENNNAGILVIKKFMVSIWKDNGLYFMYDPKSRNNQGLKEEDEIKGTSCVVWLACKKPLFELISANLEEDQKYAPFKISRVIIRTVPIESLPAPTEYKTLCDNVLKNHIIPCCARPPILPSDLRGEPEQRAATFSKAVSLKSGFERITSELSLLWGSIHMSHKNFSVDSRGHQSTSIALVALAMARLYSPATWNPSIIDALLHQGNQLHVEYAQLLQQGSRNLLPTELPELFIVGDVRVRVNLHPGFAGGLSIESDVVEALRLLFTKHELAILHTTRLALPLMKVLQKFYALDPSGCLTESRNVACLAKCESLTELAQFVLRACSLKQPTVYTLNPVQILDLRFFSH